MRTLIIIGMIREIFKKEILDSILSVKFLLTFILSSVLIIMSVFTNIVNYKNELSEYNTSVSLNKKNLEGQSNFISIASNGIKVNRKPEVLGIIINGVKDGVGSVATVNIINDPKLIDSKCNNNPIYSMFGSLDLLFIVEIVLSLVAIFFTYDAIVGEKEAGTLKLSLSNSVSRDKLILGKLIGGATILLIPLAIPLIISFIILSLYNGIDLNHEDWIRILMIVLFFILYISVFFNLGVFISTLSKRSSVSLLLLLFTWIVFVIIVPKISVLVAEQINPIPSVHEITAQKDSYLQEIQKEVPKLLKTWRNDNENLAVSDFDQYRTKYLLYAEKIQKEVSNKIDLRNAEIEKEYQKKLNYQELLALNISRISPASSIMIATSNLARTGIIEHQQFLNSIRSYKPFFTDWVNSNLLKSQEERGSPFIDLTSKPDFNYKKNSLSVDVKLVLPDLILLVLFNILFFTGAYVSFLKYEI